jgi:hypothetical protein
MQTKIDGIKRGNRSFANVSQLRYWGTTATNRNVIQEEIKRRLNSGIAYNHSVQNLLSSRLLSNSLTIRIYKTFRKSTGGNSVGYRDTYREIGIDQILSLGICTHFFSV